MRTLRALPQPEPPRPPLPGWHDNPVSTDSSPGSRLSPSRPVAVIAHRGASEAAPEHTLAAYRKAIEAGADALECDVRLTADGHLVCVHDRRINRTSNGKGAVSALELADLAALDFGSWKKEGPDEDPYESPDQETSDRTSVLTLERLLQLVAEAPQPVGLAVETKHPSRWAGQVEARLLELLEKYRDVVPSVRVMSFSARSLHRIRAAAPHIPTVYLMQLLLPRHRDGRLPPGVGIAGPSLRILRARPEYVERAHRQGNEVHVWTVNEPEDVELCVRLGVDAVITNRPQEVLSQLR
ncbi:glycerophosphoryl diester phosphodiesterase [Streptomyces sp. WMMB 322]|nr:glycerophosphoryl diester phosphodiesterase [Streptomyces sp. WMMB 322]